MKYGMIVSSALMTMALMLSACDDAMMSYAQHSSELQAEAIAEHYKVQGNPQFSDPILQAVVRKFEAQYATIGLDTDKLGLEQGQPCDATPDAAFQTVYGLTPDKYEALQVEISAKVPGYTGVADPAHVRIAILSGVCGANGPEGPAVIVTTKRNITRIKTVSSTEVTVADSVTRTDATWSQGKKIDTRESIAVATSVRFTATDDGKLTEKINDWDYLNKLASAPLGVYMYWVKSADGAAKYDVNFTREPVSGTYLTTVTEHLDEHYARQRVWMGTELFSEISLRDNQYHGWYETYPRIYNGTEIPGNRVCYQNGEPVKSMDCPST